MKHRRENKETRDKSNNRKRRKKTEGGERKKIKRTAGCG